MTMNKQNGKIGILVGGGPAPGINGVIHSATIEAISNGLEVVGIYDGFKHLMEGKLVGTPLTIAECQPDSPGRRLDPAHVARQPDQIAGRAAQLRLRAGGGGHLGLVGIGGDDTAFSLYRVVKYAQEKMGIMLRAVHVPKTIDNDLPLPEGIPTFGFETARELGTRIVMNFMEDALTVGHWFLVVTMGRKAGHLALGIGKSSGATLTLIPEEWRGREIRLQEVVDILATSIVQRLAEGKNYGVALIAEGIIEYTSHEDLQTLDRVERDEHGHVRLAEINFADVIKRLLANDLRRLGIQMKLVDKELGYELRCAAPIAYDIDYTRSLGEAAVDFLLDGGSNATITLQHNQVVPIPSETMMDPATGRTEVRMVNIDSFTYHSAYKFMIRLKPQHAQDELFWAKLAMQTNLSTEEFKARYGYLVGIAPRPF